MYILIPLLNIIGLEFVFLMSPWLIFFVGALIIVLTVIFIIRHTRAAPHHRAAIILSGVSFLAAHYGLLIFIEGHLFIQGFILVTSFALFVFFYSLYDKQHHQELRLRYALENIIGYFNLAVFYFLTVDIFYWDLQTNQKFLWFLGIFFAAALALSYSALDIFNLISRKAVVYCGVSALVGAQAFWIAKLLPISVYSQGTVVALVYYVALGLSRHYLLFGYEELTRKVVARYASISMLGMALMLLSSKWA